MIGIDRERPPEPHTRLLEIFARHVEATDVVIGPRKARIGVDRLLKHDERLVGGIVHVLQPRGGDVERLRQPRHLVIGQAIAEHPLGVLPCLHLW